MVGEEKIKIKQKTWFLRSIQQWCRVKWQIAGQAAYFTRKWEVTGITTMNELTLENWVHQLMKNMTENWEKELKMKQVLEMEDEYQKYVTNTTKERNNIPN